MKKPSAFQILLIISALVFLAAGYFGYQDWRLKQQNLSLQAEMASTTGALRSEIEKVAAERDDFSRKYDSEKNRADAVQILLGAAKDTIGVFKKLRATDPELLKKYSKVYFLNENYSPKKLSEIDAQYLYNPQKSLLFLDSILPYLEQMMADAAVVGVDIKILSAYRSFKEQADLKSSYAVFYGTGANKFSADQGYSEHQLGTAIDFTTSKLGESLIAGSFEKTQAYKWLLENAHKYGFILSYPKTNSYYKFEPWHWRFIGRDFASRLYDDKMNFYDLDQRLLDTYLITFFD
jgi:LAS superfamily LD-carboxypeptidase LdcB